MSSTYSQNLQTQLIGNGEQSGTWGTNTNINLGTLLEQAISSYCTQAFSNADVTLLIAQGNDAITTNPAGTIYTAGTTGTPVSGRNMYIECTGTINSTQYLIVPTNKKLYFIYNNTTGGTLTVTTDKTNAALGIPIPSGKRAVLVCNGTGIVPAINGITTGTGSTAWTLSLPATVGTANYVLQTNGDGTTSWVAQSGGGGGGTTSLAIGTTPVTGGTTGYFLYNNSGVVGNLAGVGTGNVQLATQNYTLLSTTASATAYTRYHLNSSGGAFTVTLPASASAGDWVQFIDAAQSCQSYNVTLANNGLKIMNNLASMAIDINSAAFYLVYSTTYGWVVS